MTDPVATGAQLFLAGVLGTVVAAAVQRNAAAAVNAVVALGVALLPWVAPPLLGVSAFPPALSLWVAVAGFLHALGMLGLYERAETWWWDHLTHAVSAALLAALLYAGLLVALPDWPSPVPGVLTVLLTVGFGVAWELVELVARDVGERFDIDPVLVYYGWQDTAFDLLFDVVGVLLVVALDLRLFVPVASRFPRATETLLLASGVAVLVGSTAMALYLRWSARTRPLGA